jgi:hypothetical protein
VRFLSAVTPTGTFGLAAGYGLSQGVEFVAEKAADSVDHKVHSMVSSFIDDIQESETMAKNFGDFQADLKNARKSGKISTQDAAKMACDHGLFGADGVGNPNAYETVEPGMDKFLSATDNFSLKTAMAAAAAGTIRNVGGRVGKKSGVDKGRGNGQTGSVPRASTKPVAPDGYHYKKRNGQYVLSKNPGALRTPHVKDGKPLPKPKPAVKLHGNDLKCPEETHVYVIRRDGDSYRIGESMKGTNKQGLSRRANTQTKKLTKETGREFDSEIRKTFPNKKAAKDHETKSIIRFRKIFGEDKLPGNKGVH